MEVSISRFWPHLVDLIPVISKSKFIAIDLEMTGIQLQHSGIGSGGRKKPLSAHDIYTQAKEATRIFRVLQLGITCITFDDVEGKFQTVSHSYHVSPMFNESWDTGGDMLAKMVDRTFSVSYNTLMFLKKNCLRLEDAYVDGIPYLSRAEEANIAPRFLLQDHQRQTDERILDDADDATKAFCQLVHDKIDHWQSSDSKKDYLNISNPHGGRLNRFQQRLIFEIIESDYPKRYRGFIKNNEFMQIVHAKNQQESAARKETIVKRKRALLEQRGLRYLIESFGGGDFAEIAQIGGPRRSPVDEETAQRLENCQQELKNNRPILIGHNMFWDLCFLYATFIGPLPDALDEFFDCITQIFPRFIDTKCITTDGEHDMMPARSLDDLYFDFEDAGLDNIPYTARLKERPAQDGKHHAGTDSYMTAVVFLREMWKRVQDAAGQEDEQHQHRHNLTDMARRIFEWDGEPVQAVCNILRLGGTRNLCKVTPSPSQAQGKSKTVTSPPITQEESRSVDLGSKDIA